MVKKIINFSLSSILFRKPSEDVKELFRESYGESLVNPIITQLEKNELFEWIDVLYEREDISSLEKQEDLLDLLNTKEIYLTLHRSSSVSWDDPVQWLYIVLDKLALHIGSSFDSTSDFIQYMRSETDIQSSGVEKIRTVETEENDTLDDIFRVVFSEISEFDIAVANEYVKASRLLDVKKRWDREISIGQYVKKVVEKNEETADILLKVVGIEEESVLLSDVAEGVSVSGDIVLEKRKLLVVENVAYDDSVLDMYENHFLLTDINETNTLSAEEESSLEVFDENPLPLS